VFAPGDYAGTDPSKATEYVYAYQAVLPSTGSRGLSTVSISLVEEGLATATGWESEAVTGGIEPIFSLVTGPAAAVDTYFVPQVVPNGYSTVFFYTSPSGPTFAPASVLGGGYSDQQMAPSPAPEPSTAVGLLSMAGAGLVAYAWRKRRSSRSCF
jgi:hypothetical protein